MNDNSLIWNVIALVTLETVLWGVVFEDHSGTLNHMKSCLSGHPLTSPFFFSNIVRHHGRMFTIKSALLSRWCSTSFIHPGQLAWAKQNALLDEMFPITQWINTNLFIWTDSWQCEPFSEFIANTLKRKVTLLKGKRKRKRINNSVLSQQWSVLLYNLAKQSTGDLHSF